MTNLRYLTSVMVVSWLMAALEGILYAVSKRRPGTRLITHHVQQRTPLGVISILWYLWLGCHFLGLNGFDGLVRGWTRVSILARSTAMLATWMRHGLSGANRISGSREVDGHRLAGWWGNPQREGL